MKWVLLILILFVTTTCKKEWLGKYRIYTIPEGKHHSTHEIQGLVRDGIMFNAKFDESAEYTSETPINQFDINKLYGFADCNNQHHTNSARFGWRWMNGEIEIFAYVYNNGVLEYKKMGSVNPNENHYYEITIYKDSYAFSLDNTYVNMSRTNRCNTGFYYKLYPYFGGDEKAPHDIRIFIDEISYN
jgi:hypothetical protein